MALNRLVFVFSAVLLLAIAGSNLERGALADEPYHIGVVLSMSGAGALYSKDGADAVMLAVEEINAKGGFLGRHPLKVVVRDDETKPEIAVRETTDLILTNKVRCILGTYSSACALAIKPVCREHKILHIAAISNSEDITKVDFSPYTFSVVPNTYMQAKAVAVGVARMAKTYQWKTYMTLASDYEWGRSAVANFVKLFGEIHPEVKLTGQFWPKLGEKDFNSYITSIMNADPKPNFVFGSLGSNDNETWIAEAKERGFFADISFPGSLISVTELSTRAQTLPRGMIGLCRAPFFAHMDNPVMAGFVQAFRSKYGRYPSDWAVMEYDAVHALRQGIEKAGTIDSDKVKDTMAGSKIVTTRGELSFRKIDNQLSCSSYLGRVRDDPDGKIPFPIYYPLWIIKGPDSWRPEAEIEAARAAKK
jgi:branched-chain amino acid transport system substrate-binding protein